MWMPESTKTTCVWKHHYIWNLITCTCEINEYLKRFADHLVITCNKIIDTLETVPLNFNEKRQLLKCKNFYTSLPFY